MIYVCNLIFIVVYDHAFQMYPDHHPYLYHIPANLLFKYIWFILSNKLTKKNVFCFILNLNGVSIMIDQNFVV